MERARIWVSRRRLEVCFRHAALTQSFSASVIPAPEEGWQQHLHFVLCRSDEEKREKAFTPAWAHSRGCG